MPFFCTLMACCYLIGVAILLVAQIYLASGSEPTYSFNQEFMRAMVGERRRDHAVKKQGKSRVVIVKR